MILTGLQLGGQGALEGQTADLLGHVDDVITGLGSEHHAAVGELGGAVAMVTRVTGALLAVDLAAAAAHFRAGRALWVPWRLLARMERTTRCMAAT